MKKNWTWLSLVFALGLTACNAQSSDPNQTAPEQATTEIKGETFGEEVDAGTVVTYPELISQMNGQDSMVVTVRGTVDAVCQMKGCWMDIVSDEVPESMKVRFKDYGFFVPKDIAGREVIMQGVATYQETSVDDLRHYAEDAGKSAEEIEAITEPRRELSFLASGVLLLEE